MHEPHDHEVKANNQLQATAHLIGSDSNQIPTHGNHSSMTATPELNFEVQHVLVAKEALIGCFVAMSFSGSVV